MSTSEIIKEIEKLPLSKRMYIIEKAMSSIKKQSLEQAAELLYKDYESDKELTAFTTLDFENFYETK